MPLYAYRCACGNERREFNTIANRHNGPECCGDVMQKVIEAPQIQAQILGGGNLHGYKCPITGKWVTSRKERRNIMAEHGVVEAGDSSNKSRHREQMLANTNGSGVAN